LRVKDEYDAFLGELKEAGGGVADETEVVLVDE